ncbi:MAG: hypothetical protein ACOYOB_01605 [Myxococcota bacterium]
MVRKIIELTMLFGFMLQGCRQDAPTPEQPVWGKQPCDYCAMLLSDRLHGAQELTAEGDRLFFDDLGCMVAWDAEHPRKTRSRWVRRFDQPPQGTGWLPAEQAAYVRVPGTPMAFGFAGVANPLTIRPPQPQVSWTQVVAAVHKRLGVK